MTSVVELSVGKQVWFEGETWDIASMSAAATQLTRGDIFRSVATRSLLESAKIIDDDTQPAEEEEFQPPSNVVLSDLSPVKRAKLDQRAALVRPLLEYDGEVSLKQRLGEAAASARVSTRTLERWMTGYRNGGLAGLADSRMTGRYATGIDSRWDAACTEVLAEYTTRSTPTMGVVLDKVEQRVDEQHGFGVVSAPSRSSAYRRLKELSKGRHAFGSGKQRRSVADRPRGPYGRLRATRPGE